MSNRVISGSAWTGRVGLLVLVGVLVPALSAEAGVISATGSAEWIDQGDWSGWYKYTYTIEWSLDRGLSHLDLLLKPGCIEEDHQFGFDTDTGGLYDGQSTGKRRRCGDPVVFTVFYEGRFEVSGDPSLGISVPLVKWEPVETRDGPGKQGTGQFWFYSNVVPEYGNFDDVVVAKYGRCKVTGNLTGAYPSCHIIPEAGTVGLMVAGFGVLAVLRRRRGVVAPAG